MLRLALLFLILIIYGSLYPFTDWAMPSDPIGGFLTAWPSQLSRADLVQNVLAYAPFGLFLGAWLHGRWPLDARAVAARATLAGVVLSLTMEWAQQFEPARTASLADIVMNGLGCLIGAVLAVFLQAPGGNTSGAAPAPSRNAPRNTLQATLHRVRAQLFETGELANLGLAALALWALAETSPLAPVFERAYLLGKIGYIKAQLAHPLSISAPQLFVRFVQLTSLGLLLRLLMRGGASAFFGVFASMLAAVFALKLLVYGRALSVEQLGGALAALAVLAASRRAPRASNALAGAALLLCGFVADELSPGPGLINWQFNWIPLWGQMRSLSGLENILELFWPFFALAVLARMVTPARRSDAVSWLGGLLVLALVFRLEWMQQALPGRYGDITQVLLALGGWLLPWSFRQESVGAPGRRAVPALARLPVDAAKPAAAPPIDQQAQGNAPAEPF